MDDFDFEIINFDGSIPRFSVIDYSIDVFSDKAGSLSLTVDGKASVSRDASVEVQYKGSILFRGVLDKPIPMDDGTIKLEFRDRVDLLGLRYSLVYDYPEATTIDAILSSTSPLGILHLANGLIPQGAWVKYKATDHRHKMFGCGTGSSHGTITSLTQDGVALTQAANAGDVNAAGKWFQDADYLWIWCLTSVSPRLAEIKHGSTLCPGCWYYSPAAFGNIYMLEGAGTGSIFGTISSMYSGSTSLTAAASLGAMSAGKFFQDAANLYVQCPANGDPNTLAISVPNFKDTRLRLGNVAPTGYTFDEAFSLAKQAISSELAGALSHLDYEWGWRHSPDGYIYLDIANEIARGTAAAPVKTWAASALTDFQEERSNESSPTALITTGAEGTHAAACDFSAQRVWRELSSAENSKDQDSLIAFTVSRFARLRNMRTFTFSVEPDLSLRCNDYVLIKRDKLGHIRDRVQAINFSYGNLMKVTVGPRVRDLKDVWGISKKLQDSMRKRCIFEGIFRTDLAANEAHTAQVDADRVYTQGELEEAALWLDARITALGG